jgi:alkylation response protein AidB-like acyl-CoA dehydrogenase
MTTTTEVRHSLDESTLDRFRERAAFHDAAGIFPSEDLDDLRAVDWLRAALPESSGGLGLKLDRLGRAQRRMARYSAATALSTGMHHYWVGMAADLAASGVPGPARILGWVADGELLASGHAEVGNDIPLSYSTTRAERVTGGWRIHGRKMFGSLGPHWDRMGLHAMDASGDEPVIVHGFVRRSATGVEVLSNWDTQGMRATESHDTVLDGAFMPDEDVLCVVPAGPSNDPRTGVMQVWALTLIANTYVGIAERALEIAIRSATSRTSIAIPGSTYSRHPHVQSQVSDMHLALDAARTLVDQIGVEWTAGVDHGPMWGVKVLTAKWHAATAAMRVVDLACDVVGGASYRRGTELERLSRDVRAARFHPGTDAFTHEVIGKALLGVTSDGGRW